MKNISKTILVVDDSRSTAAEMSDVLGTEFRVIAARSAQSALEFSRQGIAVDLVLLDIAMPDLDGLTLLERLRAVPAYAHVPAVFVTAMDDTLNRERAARLGAAAYLCKPVDPDDVLALCRELLGAGDDDRLSVSRA